MIYVHEYVIIVLWKPEMFSVLFNTKFKGALNRFLKAKVKVINIKINVMIHLGIHFCGSYHFRITTLLVEIKKPFSRYEPGKTVFQKIIGTKTVHIITANRHFRRLTRYLNLHFFPRTYSR